MFGELTQFVIDFERFHEFAPETQTSGGTGIYRHLRECRKS